MGRVRLGSWHLRSGNCMASYLEADHGADVRQLTCEWDTPPPLSRADAREYHQGIFPELLARVREYLEAIGPTLVLR